MTSLKLNLTTNPEARRRVYEQLQTLDTDALYAIANGTPELREALALALAGDRRQTMPAGYYRPGDYVIARIFWPGVEEAKEIRCKVHRVDAHSNDVWLTSADLKESFDGIIVVDATNVEPFELS